MEQDQTHNTKNFDSTIKNEYKQNRRIYLDNNATTPIAKEVRDIMLPYLTDLFGNPSSIHVSGREAKEAIEQARRQVAKLINTMPRRIIYTGGGSEADNLALKGAAFKLRDKGNHIITTNIEHPAVLRTCSFLEKLGFEVTYLEADTDGLINLKQLRESIKAETILVSIMLANNEAGTILPIKELAIVAHTKGVLFHTDAVQAIGKIEVDVDELGVDLLSISGHKFHSPKGVGALYIKKGVYLEPLIHGGGQENGLRAGTENVASIVGLGKAAELVSFSLNEASRIKSLRDKLERGIKKLLPETKLNGPKNNRLPNTLNVTLPGIRGETLVIEMDKNGISLSSGSACNSGSPAPTHVLLNMGRTEEEAHSSVRFSLSVFTTEKDIDDTLKILEKVIKQIKEKTSILSCR
jgi:cysteine desulfurase NifS